MKNKAQFDFNWLFALLAGAAILVLAIYGVAQLGDSMRFKSDTETATQISILTDPLQAGFAEGKFGKIIFRQETRIINDCYSESFGTNEISVSTHSDVGEEWLRQGVAAKVPNKYIFSSYESGKTFYVFSKPFYYPFKVSDLVFVSSKNYCFVNPSEEIKEDILGLNMENIKLKEEQNCSKDSLFVCFNTNQCDINVYGDSEQGYVEKGGKTMNYVGNLIYGAIFSEKELYDCNVMRLMYRTSKSASVFSEKSDLMNGRACNTNLKSDLLVLSGSTLGATSDNLLSNYKIAQQIELKNNQELCGLW